MIIGITGVDTGLIEVQTGESAAGPGNFSEELVAEVEGLGLLEDTPPPFEEFNDPFDPVDGGCTTQ